MDKGDIFAIVQTTKSSLIQIDKYLAKIEKEQIHIVTSNYIFECGEKQCILNPFNYKFKRQKQYNPPIAKAKWTNHKFNKSCHIYL